MRKRLLASVSAAALALALTACGQAEDTYDASIEDSSSVVYNGNILFDGGAYSVTLDGTRWTNRDNYMEELREQGYTFEEKDIEGVGFEGSYFFTDEGVKEGMENESFTYDVPFLNIAAPYRASNLNEKTIDDIADSEIEKFRHIYEGVDGMEIDEEKTGLTDIGGIRFLKIVSVSSLADGAIKLRRVNYETVQNGSRYSFMFSSTEELAERMEPEYEEVLATFTIK